MASEQEIESDLIVKCFNRNLHHVLEPVFLALPPSSILACQQVSKEWKDIAMFYHESRLPRIQKLQESRSYIFIIVAVKMARCNERARGAASLRLELKGIDPQIRN